MMRGEFEHIIITSTVYIQQELLIAMTVCLNELIHSVQRAFVSVVKSHSPSPVSQTEDLGPI